MRTEGTAVNVAFAATVWSHSVIWLLFSSRIEQTTLPGVASLTPVRYALISNHRDGDEGTTVFDRLVSAVGVAPIPVCGLVACAGLSTTAPFAVKSWRVVVSVVLSAEADA